MSNLKKITQKRLFLPIFCMVLVLCINMVYDVASGNSFYNLVIVGNGSFTANCTY